MKNKKILYRAKNTFYYISSKQERILDKGDILIVLSDPLKKLLHIKNTSIVEVPEWWFAGDDGAWSFRPIEKLIE